VRDEAERIVSHPIYRAFMNVHRAPRRRCDRRTRLPGTEVRRRCTADPDRGTDADDRCGQPIDDDRVEIDDENVYEPDVTVQCGQPIDLDSTPATHPTILVEVSSPSTKGVDSSKKLLGYFQLPGVQQYLVVDPARRAVIHHRRTDNGVGTALVREGALQLDPPGIELKIADFFDGLDGHP